MSFIQNCYCSYGCEWKFFNIRNGYCSYDQEEMVLNRVIAVAFRIQFILFVMMVMDLTIISACFYWLWQSQPLYNHYNWRIVNLLLQLWLKTNFIINFHCSYGYRHYFLDVVIMVTVTHSISSMWLWQLRLKPNLYISLWLWVTVTVTSPTRLACVITCLFYTMVCNTLGALV